MIDSQTFSITTCNLTRVQSVTPQDMNDNRKETQRVNIKIYGLKKIIKYLKMIDKKCITQK